MFDCKDRIHVTFVTSNHFNANTVWNISPITTKSLRTTEYFRKGVVNPDNFIEFYSFRR